MSPSDPLRSAAGWKLTLSAKPPGGGGDALGVGAKLVSALLPAAVGDDIVLSHAQYRAEITVSKGIGLDGGRVRIQIQRLPFRLLQKLLGAYEDAAKPSGDGAQGEYYGKLQLLWRVPAPYPALDAAVDLAQDLAGAEPGDLAAVFVVTGLTTEVDRVNYRLVIEGVDAAWYRLATQRVKQPNPLATADDVRTLCKGLGISCGPSGGGGGGVLTALSEIAGLGGASGTSGAKPDAGSVSAQLTQRERPLDRLSQVQAAIAEAAKSDWLGGFLLDNGHLLVGQDVRDLFDAKAADVASDVISSSMHRRDPTATGAREQGAVVTVRGNAKLKPGQVVRFNFAKQAAKSPSTGLGYADAAISLVSNPLGDKGGDPVCVYIRSVSHRQGSSIGFVSEIEGVVVGGAKQTLPKQPQPVAPAPIGSSPHAAAGTIKGAIEQRNRSAFEIGEVRTFRPTTSGTVAPGQTSDIIAGLAEGKGDVQWVRTRDLQREKPHRASAIPYVTPFAWGKFGMVLPRYPGMRLALAQPQASLEQAIDIGALWWSGEDKNANAGPASAEAGDYWLILPVDPKVGTAADEPASELHADAKAASHDLTNQKGQRFIQLRELTVRVGEWTLKAPETRPGASAAEGGLRIEGKDGTAFIQIDKDGNIKIETPKKLSLKADEGIVIESDGGVSLKSAGVEALLKQGKLDVK